MSKIEAIRAHVVEIPLRVETAFSTRSLDKRVYLYVEVESAAKIRSGFCYLGHTGSSMALSAVNQLLSPILLGADALARSFRLRAIPCRCCCRSVATPMPYTREGSRI
jgi:hypothetical protein